MNNLIPRFIYENFLQGDFSGSFPAVSLFVDIAGFTAMSEQLMQHGKEGAEILSETLLAIFDPMLESILAQDGIITGFAGDALTALFPIPPENPAVAYQQALAVAHAIQHHFHHNGRQETPLGPFTFACKQGMADGLVQWGILGGERYTYYFYGPAVDDCAHAEHQAKPGDLILSRPVAAQLSQHITVEPAPAHHLRLTAITAPLPPPQPVEPWHADPAVLLNFFPAALVHLPARGEFRPVVTLLIGVQDVPTVAHLEAMMPAVFELAHQYGGTFARLDFGDKGCTLLIFWGAPITYENNVSRALDFLLELRAVMPPIRVGVTHHPMYAGRAGGSHQCEFSCYGRGVSLAARLMVAAEWGEILLDANVAAEAGRTFHLAPKGERLLKGFDRPQPLHALLARRETPTFPYQGQMVGRAAELAQLTQFLQPIFDETNPRFAGLMTVYGEPGMGKTRLLYELEQQLAAENNVYWCACPCDEVLRQPLNPFKNFLKHFFEQQPAASAAENHTRYTATLARLLAGFQEAATLDDRFTPIAAELNRTASILAALLDLPDPGSLWAQLDPKLRFENTLQALKNLFKGLSLRRPLILFIDDLQWMDDESHQFIHTLTHNIENLPLAILATGRYLDDGTKPTFNKLPADLQPQEIILELLGRDQVKAIAEKVVGTPVAEEIITFLTQKTEGNPFFVEQLMLHLKEQGLPAAAPELAAVPPSITGVLIARLDRLPLPVKIAVQTAAVLGFQFELHILQQMLHDEARLPQRIRAASQAAIWTAMSEIEYIFKHALMRQAAYEMQLHARLRETHRLAAQAYETIYHADLSPYYATLAYHYEQAQSRDQMLLYLEKAADHAAAHYANEAALTFYEKLLTASLPPRHALTIAKKKADVWYQGGNYKAAIQQLEAAVTASQALGDLQQQCECYVLLGQLLWRIRDPDRSLVASTAGRQLAEQLNDHKQLALALKNIGVAEHMRGHVALALDYHHQARQRQAEIGDKKELANTLNSIGVITWREGDLAGSLAANLEAKALQEETGHRPGLAHSLNNIGEVYKAQGDYTAALNAYHEALAIARELGLRLTESLILNNIANVYTARHDYDTAHLYHQPALTLAQELGIPYWYCAILDSQVETLWRQGQSAAATTANEHLHQLASQNKLPDFIWSAELMRARLLAQSDPTAALTALETLLAAATETTHPAREQKAKLHDELWQLATRLGRPEQANHHRQQALRLYQTLYQQMPILPYHQRLSALSSP